MQHQRMLDLGNKETSIGENKETSMEIPRCATPSDVCDELERAIELDSNFNVVVYAVHLRWLIEDARTLRRLTEVDLPDLVNPPRLEPPRTLWPNHHLLAQLLAQGRSETEVAQITGHSLSNILTLKSDPTFAELVADYRKLWSR